VVALTCLCGAELTTTPAGICESTDGPIEMVTARCHRGHWFRCGLGDLESLLAGRESEGEIERSGLPSSPGPVPQEER
jgi:hypothetical protein